MAMCRSCGKEDSGSRAWCARCEAKAARRRYFRVRETKLKNNEKLFEEDE